MRCLKGKDCPSLQWHLKKACRGTKAAERWGAGGPRKGEDNQSHEDRKLKLSSGTTYLIPLSQHANNVHMKEKKRKKGKAMTLLAGFPRANFGNLKHHTISSHSKIDGIYFFLHKRRTFPVTAIAKTHLTVVTTSTCLLLYKPATREGNSQCLTVQLEPP